MTTAIIAFLAAAAGSVLGSRLTRRQMQNDFSRRLDQIDARMRSSSEQVERRLEGSAAALDEQMDALRTELGPAAVSMESKTETVAGSSNVPDEVVHILAAAICAYLGKPARIRSIRTKRQAIGTTAWAMQGRALVQGSHNLRQTRN